MNTALIGGTSEAPSRWRPTSRMLSVRVPSGTGSGRASRPGVFGNAKDARLTSPPPGTPNFPASAGSAKIARMPLPPFWFRSSPLPTLIAAGESVWYHSASARTSSSGTPHTRAASETLQRRASAMNSSTPSTWRPTNARSIPPRRSSSAATAQASTTSVPGRRARWRRARVVERQDRLGAVRGDDRAEPRVDRVERLPPRDTLEAPLASGAHAPERRAEASGPVDERRVRLRHLRAEHATGVRVGVRAADLDDPVLLDRDREAAGVGAIERADTRSFDAHGRHRTRIGRHRGRGNAPVLLQGIRVVEAASMVLVPSAAAMLADFGAEVIKVEPPEGDYNRKMHELPTLPQSEAPYCFLVDGRSKQSIVLDLKSTDGVA